jgi:hypothetical protein
VVPLMQFTSPPLGPVMTSMCDGAGFFRREYLVRGEWCSRGEWFSRGTSSRPGPDPDQDDGAWVWLFWSECLDRGSGGAGGAPGPRSGSASGTGTTAMLHRRCPDHRDAPSSWLRPGWYLRLHRYQRPSPRRRAGTVVHMRQMGPETRPSRDGASPSLEIQWLRQRTFLILSLKFNERNLLAPLSGRGFRSMTQGHPTRAALPEPAPTRAGARGRLAAAPAAGQDRRGPRRGAR